MNTLPQDEQMEKRAFQTSCERCRRRKIKCDRIQPCQKCEKAKAECNFIGSGEKQRPSPRGYVQALKGQIASLEKFITKLASESSAQRDQTLATFRIQNAHKIENAQTTKMTEPAGNAEYADTRTPSVIPIRSRTGHLRRLKDGKAAEFYGATSFFQISPSQDQEPTPPAPEIPRKSSPNHSSQENTTFFYEFSPNDSFSPQGPLCRNLVAAFFKDQYQYHMCLYREYFLRDYDKGSGPYYSDILLYAICAMGALAVDDASREISDICFSRAQQLLYGSALESPNLTTLQALILMGHREIGQGKTSKGWLFSGMAFRLAHEMGLHLDPTNWNGSVDSRVEREILRRTYWAAFIADKHLSLYFGRPPALYPGQADVHDTMRIPYPAEWEGLLNRYIMAGTSENAYEDGMTLVAAFVQQAELCKILHRMITEVFENRHVEAQETVLSNSINDIHVALNKWAADLPAKLHWNQWSVGPISSLVLHLHMLYHTSLIILHRPPRNLFRDPQIANSLDVQICYESLESIIKLIRIYARTYKYSHLPFTVVHILASAASIILMKRYIESSSWETVDIAKPLGLVLEAIENVSHTWPCANQVRVVIDTAMKSSGRAEGGGVALIDSPESFDLMTGIPDSADLLDGETDQLDFELADGDTQFYMPEPPYNGQFIDNSQWEQIISCL